jgi:hypothetical protein
MPRVRNHGLRVEKVSPNSFGNRHAKIGIQANSSYPYTSIVLVRRREVGVVMVVVVMRMAHMGASLRLGAGRH